MFAAFFVIFFIIILFVTGTIVLSACKNAPLIGTGENEIGLKELPNSLRVQRTLIRFLNSEIQAEGIKIRVLDYVLNKKEFDETLDSYLNVFFKDTDLHSIIKLKGYENGKEKLSWIELGRDNDDGYRLECFNEEANLKFFNTNEDNNKISSIEILVCNGYWITNQDVKNNQELVDTLRGQGQGI